MFYMASNMKLFIYIYRIMDQEDSKKVKRTDSDVNTVLHSDPDQGNKDVSVLPLKKTARKRFSLNFY